MKTVATPLVIALSLAFAAGHVQAQLAVRDGTSNTVLLGESIGGSLTTRATVAGNIGQSSNQGVSSSSRQSVSIGGARAVSDLTGSVTTQGNLTGNLSQSRDGNPGGGADQSINIGGVAGSLTARGVQANGSVLTSISQSTLGAGGSAPVGNQTVDVGEIRDSRGGSLISSGVVSGAGVAQSSRSQVAQELLIGSIANANVQTGRTSGLVSAQVTQSNNSTSDNGTGLQRLAVGDIRDTQAQSVTTQGQLAGALTQSKTGRGDQLVEIGSVSGVDAGGTISATGVVTGKVDQQSTDGRQRLSVGSVNGGSATLATASGTLTGDVSQTQSGHAGGEQRILVGAIDASAGRVTTDATVGAAITQTAGGVGSSAHEQSISIGSAERTAGTVSARAVVNGSVRQTNFSGQTFSQSINIGSAQNSGGLTVHTDVTVAGDITQSTSNGNSRGSQNILIGGVVGN